MILLDTFLRIFSVFSGSYKKFAPAALFSSFLRKIKRFVSIYISGMSFIGVYIYKHVLRLAHYITLSRRRREIFGYPLASANFYLIKPISVSLNTRLSEPPSWSYRHKIMNVCCLSKSALYEWGVITSVVR